MIPKHYVRRQQNENRGNNKINGYGLYRQYNQFKSGLSSGVCIQRLQTRQESAGFNR